MIILYLFWAYAVLAAGVLLFIEARRSLTLNLSIVVGIIVAGWVVLPIYLYESFCEYRSRKNGTSR